jgi:hypothetical protein
MPKTEKVCENTEGNNKLYKNTRLSGPSVLATIKTGLAAEVSKERGAYL